MDCLQILAKTAPDDYFAAASSEELVLDRLWMKLKESKLITSEGNGSYAAKLHQIFDLGIENGITSLIFEVLEEVCYLFSDAVTASGIVEVLLNLNVLCAVCW
jgi:hypothetical protein